MRMRTTLAALCCLILCAVSATVTPVVYETTSTSQCGQEIVIENDQHLMEKLEKVQQLLPLPGPSKKNVSSMTNNSFASSEQIQAANSSAINTSAVNSSSAPQVVSTTSMEEGCGGEGGWMKIAHLNMTDPSSQCPAGFTLQTANNKRFCVRDTSACIDGCCSMVFQTFGMYSCKCGGYARAYASQGDPDAFANPTGMSPVLLHSVVTMLMVSLLPMVLHLLTYGPMLLEHQYLPTVNMDVLAILNQVFIHLRLWVVTTTARLEPLSQDHGALVTLYGMVCSVKGRRDLVVVTLYCLGSRRAQQALPPPLGYVYV